MTKFYSLKKTVILNVFFLIFFITSLSSAQTNKNEIILNISINGEKKGDLFCIIEDDNIFIPLDELKELGLKKAPDDIKIFDNKSYINIKTWQDIKFTFNEEKLELELIVPPEYLPENVINFQPQRKQNVIIPDQNSAFLNYRFDYTNIEGSQDFFLNHDLGIRFNKFTFVSKGFYYDQENKYTRLDTTIYFDDRKQLTRLSLGDFITPSSPTSSGGSLGGISYFKHFAIDPYYIYKPTFDIRTYTTFRSEVEVYLDNVLIKKEFVPPGELNLTDLYYYGGRKDIKVLIKDPFGRTEVYSYPMYFSDIMLKKGMREFNYSIGFIRENYSVKSNKYSSLDIVAMERYGYNHFLNLGGRFEAIPSKDYYNINAETILLLGNIGVLGLLGAYSNLDDKTGTALMASYSFQQKNFSFRTTGFASSDNYTGSYKKLNEQIKKSFSTGMNYYIPKFGSLSLDFIHNKYKDSEKNLINFGYTKSIKGNISFFASLIKKYEKQNTTEFFIGISIYPEKDYTISTRYEDMKERTAEAIQISKLAPISEGFGYRVTLEHEKTKSSTNTINPYLQLRSSFGVFEADGLMKYTKEKLYENFRLAYSGAVSYVSGTIGLIRPINDSFALVRVNELQNVKVDLNGQAIGKTNKKGYIFVPDMNSYYDNLITVNDKDIPFDYDILTREITVSPWYKSGFCLKFPIERLYRYSGFLIGNFEGTKKPLEFVEIIIENKFEPQSPKETCISSVERVIEKEIKIITGKDGEFYIENLRPGTYKGKILYKDNEIWIEFNLKDSREYINNIGNIEVNIPSTFEKGRFDKTILSEDYKLVAKQDKKAYELPKIEENFINPSQGNTENKELKTFTVYFKFDSDRLVSQEDYYILGKVSGYLNKTEKFIKLKDIATKLVLKNITINLD